MPPKRRREASAAYVEVGAAGPGVVISPNPAPVGTTKLTFRGIGFAPNTTIFGTVTGRAPSFEADVAADGTFDAAWDNPLSPLGVGAVSGPEDGMVSFFTYVGQDPVVVLEVPFKVVA